MCTHTGVFVWVYLPGIEQVGLLHEEALKIQVNSGTYVFTRLQLADQKMRLSYVSSELSKKYKAGFELV